MILDLFKSKKNLKLLDSSVLIDGRIIDVIKTGFLEGDLLLPNIIIEELQKLSDSKDHDKRQKGRKGLDVVQKIQKTGNVSLWNESTSSIDGWDFSETDIKLVLLCKHLKAKLLTLDFGLNGVAKIHGVSVLSLHSLYNAIKPKLMVGDEISVKIKEKGKEDGQGRGDYEGIMVIVDDGGDFVGKKVKVEIRQVLSMPTGILIFSKMLQRAKEERNDNIQG